MFSTDILLVVWVFILFDMILMIDSECCSIGSPNASWLSLWCLGVDRSSRICVGGFTDALVLGRYIAPGGVSLVVCWWWLSS